MYERTLFNHSFIRLLFGNLFFWFSVNLFMPVLPIYYHELGMDDGRIGLTIGAFSLGTVAFRIIAGRAVDRYGSLPVMTVGVLVSISSMLAYLWDFGPLLNIFARFAHGAGISGYATAGLTTAVSLHSDSFSTQSVAWYTLFTMVGMGLATSVAGSIFAEGGLLWIVIGGAATTIATYLLFPRIKINREVKTEKMSEAVPIKTIVFNPGVYVPTFGLLAINLGFGVAMTFYPLFQVTSGVAQTDLFFIAYSVSVVLVRLWVGKLCEWLTAEKLVGYVLFTMAGSLVLAGLNLGYGLSGVVGLGVGITYGLAFPALATTLMAHVSKSSRGIAFGFFTMAIDSGFALGSVLMGYAAMVWGYGAIFYCTGVLVLLYAILYACHFYQTVRQPADV